METNVENKNMEDCYTSYRTALIVCIIVFISYLIAILYATLNTSKKGLTIDSEREELDEEDNLFIPLYTGFVTLIVIGTIALSHFKKKGTSNYYSMKENGINKEVKFHNDNYKSYLKNYNDTTDPKTGKGNPLDEKFLLKMPYYDSLVITSIGLLLTSFLGVFLFKRTLFCKRQCYAGKANKCCSTHLMCPAMNKNTPDFNYQSNLYLDFLSSDKGDQLITIDRGENSSETFPSFYVDIRRGSSTGMVNILPDPKSYLGCCCSSFSGASGVSFYIPEEGNTNQLGITNLLVECIGNETDNGLCRTITAEPKENSLFFVTPDPSVGETGFDISYKNGTDSTFKNSTTGISTNNINGIVQQIPAEGLPFESLEVNPTEQTNLYTLFYERHNNVLNEVEKTTGKGFTKDLVCIDPGFRYIDCKHVKPVPVTEYDTLGPSARYWNVNPATGERQYFPACFENTGVNQNTNKSNSGNNNFETVGSRIFGTPEELQSQNKATYSSYVVGGPALSNGTTLTTYSFNPSTVKYEGNTSQGNTSFGPGDISINTRSLPYTDSSTFCFRNIDASGDDVYNPFSSGTEGNPLNNNIASQPQSQDTTSPSYYITHAPNSFQSGSTTGKKIDFHMGFNYDPSGGVISNLINNIK